MQHIYKVWSIDTRDPQRKKRREGKWCRLPFLGKKKGGVNEGDHKTTATSQKKWKKEEVKTGTPRRRLPVQDHHQQVKVSRREVAVVCGKRRGGIDRGRTATQRVKKQQNVP